MSSSKTPVRSYPHGKDFAFTIVDDTDDSTVENVKPIYDLLHELGLRTTKTVWPLDCPEGSKEYFAGHTLGRDDYRRFAHNLNERGFELTWHCATMESSDRERTIRGLEAFRGEFGHYPDLHCNHGQNRENIYWGPNRYVNPGLKLVQRMIGRGRDPAFSGENEKSPYFWGDLCRTHFRYVRGFAFGGLNTLRYDPDLVYQLSWTPYVNHWFSSSDAPDVAAFLRLVTREGIDKLREERGTCILSTHLGKGFVRGGRIDPGVVAVFTYLASQPGWFVPASRILDHFAQEGSGRTRGMLKQARLEVRHAVDRLQVRG